MRMPVAPPHEQAIWDAVLKGAQGADHLARLLGAPLPGQGSYLHWDDLRRRPPPEGLTREEWWLSIKLRRRSGQIVTPFRDKSGQTFWFCEPPALRAALRNVDLHWGGAMGAQGAATPTAGEGRAYLVRSLAEEPFSSSFLEGAATTREIAKDLIFHNRAPRTRDELMVLNNFKALNQVKAMQGLPLTPQGVLDLHRTVTAGTLDRPEMAGVLRGPNDHVHVFDNSTQDILHTPPDAVSLPDRLMALCAFANQVEDESSFIHPVLKAIIIHFMIAYDHPFVDGNGRTARALFYWMMLKSGYWLTEYISISSVISDAPVRYGRAYLETETDEGDLTYFIMHQCAALAQSEARLRDYIERKRHEVETLADVIEQDKRQGGYNHRQTNLLNDFVRKRLISINIADHQYAHNVSYHTARNDLEGLARRGMLVKRRRGRDVVYVAAANLEGKLLTRPTP